MFILLFFFSSIALTYCCFLLSYPPTQMQPPSALLHPSLRCSRLLLSCPSTQMQQPSALLLPPTQMQPPSALLPPPTQMQPNFSPPPTQTQPPSALLPPPTQMQPLSFLLLPSAPLICSLILPLAPLRCCYLLLYCLPNHMLLIFTLRPHTCLLLLSLSTMYIVQLSSYPPFVWHFPLSLYSNFFPFAFLLICTFFFLFLLSSTSHSPPQLDLLFLSFSLTHSPLFFLIVSFIHINISRSYFIHFNSLSLSFPFLFLFFHFPGSHIRLPLFFTLIHSPSLFYYFLCLPQFPPHLASTSFFF